MNRFRWRAISGFALAMAFAEAATIVSLKRLYFPEGWRAPFHSIPPDAMRLEQGRELATLFAIVSVASLGRPGAREGIARALWIAGLWDLAYYALLRCLTGFPSTVSDLDVVFLLPRAWILPVWVPLVGSLAAMAIAFRLGRRRPASGVC